MTDLNRREASSFSYQGEDGRIRIEVRSDDETVWLAQTSLGELFGHGDGDGR